MLKKMSALGVAMIMSSAAWAADVQPILKSDMDILGDKITYPGGQAAEISGFIITMMPGENNGWHSHPVPTFGYMLSGELTVEYETGVVKVIKAGESIIEAQHTVHQGFNRGTEPVKIIVFYAGTPGLANTDHQAN